MPPDATSPAGWNWSHAVLDFNRDDYYRANVPGCSDLSNSLYLASLVSITVTPANPTIAYGTNQQFTAAGTYSDASTADLSTSVTWTSDSPAIATTGAGGLVHAVGVGTTSIGASFGAVSGSALITVGKAPQSIDFAPPENKTNGDPDFTVSATASSGLLVSFAASGNCTVSGAMLHLVSAGSCTLTASQAGNWNYDPAPAVSHTFSIAPTPRKTCKVPNVIGKRLRAAKLAIKNRHCRTGQVRHAYSPKRRKGTVISQSRRPSKTVPANSTINLVVSQGRKR